MAKQADGRTLMVMGFHLQDGGDLGKKYGLAQQNQMMDQYLERLVHGFKNFLLYFTYNWILVLAKIMCFK